MFALHNGAGNHDLYLHDYELSSSTNITLSATITEDHPTFSPDGGMIAYESEVTDGSNQRDILREPSDNSSSVPQILLNANTATPEWQPEIWPDGERIRFTFGDFGAAAADIYIANVDGSGTPYEVSATDSGTRRGRSQLRVAARRRDGRVRERRLRSGTAHVPARGRHRPDHAAWVQRRGQLRRQRRLGARAARLARTRSPP